MFKPLTNWSDLFSHLLVAKILEWIYVFVSKQQWTCKDFRHCVIFCLIRERCFLVLRQAKGIYDQLWMGTLVMLVCNLFRRVPTAVCMISHSIGFCRTSSRGNFRWQPIWASQWHYRDWSFLLHSLVHSSSYEGLESYRWSTKLRVILDCNTI